MIRRLISMLATGAIALTALPALAQDASSASSASSESTVSSASSSSVSSTSSSSSSERRMKQNNLGQMIKSKCSELSGKSREQCVHSTIRDRKITGKSVKKPMMKMMLKKTCGEHTKGSDEFKKCVQDEKEKGMKKNPSGVMKKIEDMRMKYRNKGGMR